MRIDNDCIRDILFLVESESTYDSPIRFKNSPLIFSSKQLSKYETDKIMYHVRNLLMSGLLFVPEDKKIHSAAEEYWVDLTPSGHEFISNIREDNNWKKIKSISSTVGFAGLKTIAAISEGVATAAINTQLGFSK